MILKPRRKRPRVLSGGNVWRDCERIQNCIYQLESYAMFHENFDNYFNENNPQDSYILLSRSCCISNDTESGCIFPHHTVQQQFNKEHFNKEEGFLAIPPYLEKSIVSLYQTWRHRFNL